MTTSIIIPAFNAQEWLTDAIDSAVSHMGVEVIIVNDGSTDGTKEIAEKWSVSLRGGDRIRLINQVNKGLSSARNTGIMNARGERILFLDADDMLLDDSVKKLNQIMDETDADVVCGSFKTFGTTSEKVELIPNPTLQDFKDGNRLGYSGLFKKEVLLEVGGYSPRMTWGFEDLHLWHDLLNRGKKIVTTPETLWLYRTKERSMIHEANEHAEELIAQINKDFYA